MSAPSFVKPFGFQDQLQSVPKPGFDGLPFFDLLVIFLFAAMTSSHWVLLPGVAIELPVGTSQVTMPAGPVTVLTVSANNMLFVDGLKVTDATLADFLERSSGRARSAAQSGTLLIKADRTVPSGQILQYMELARSAGFERVQLAMEPDRSAIGINP
ncbi:MAG: biopolymer transporter ExbD [Verrucomicrobia bacterium]|nr:biopolymer transporter ExbD [Verrucomicrobiota bacterium]